MPLRDKKTFKPLNGIILGDCGKKMGYDGIDNGFILFNHVRIPRENMLNRISNVTKEGIYETSIPNMDKRFALTIGSLSFGRVSIVNLSGMTLAYALKIALRFAAMRRQFGKPGEKTEVPLLEYPLH